MTEITIDLSYYGEEGTIIHPIFGKYNNRRMTVDEQEEFVSILSMWLISKNVDFATKLLVIHHIITETKDFTNLLTGKL